MALSGVLSALRASGQPQSALVNQRIVVLGAGTAGLGVANSIKYGMQQMGLSAKKASQRFWLLDQKGVLGKGRQANSEAQAAYVRSDIEDGVPLEVSAVSSQCKCCRLLCNFLKDS
jgi:malic enzyme